MLSHRLYVVAVLETIFLTGTLLLLGALEPVYAQCESGAECEETVPPTATPVRTDCPPGSHPVGLGDCEVDGTGSLPGPIFSEAGGPISALVDFNFDGTTLLVNGSLSDPDNIRFNRRTESIAQICGGDSIHNNVNYRAYIVVNNTNQVHTVNIQLTRNSGSLQPVLHLYDNSFDPANPANNCLKADEGNGTTAQIDNFTWSPGDQFVVVATGLSNSSDEGNFTFTITPVGSEQEPNDDPSSARPITPNIDWITAEISPTLDEDYYRFEGVAGQRVWVYVRTDQSTDSQDSLVEIRNGLDALVTSDNNNRDDNNGGQGDDSSAIAGFNLTETRSYYIRVTEALSAATITPYYLYVYLSDQDSIQEIESNNNTSTATTYDSDGGLTYHLPPQIFGGHQNNVTNGIDFFKFTVPISSVILTGLDPDSDDNTTEFTGTLSLYNVAGTQVISVASGNTSPIAEALSYGQTASETITTTTWYASVISTGTGINLPYNLLVGYSPTTQGDVTYSTDANKFIFPDGSTITSTLISGHFCMDNLDVWLDIDHDNLNDLDISLQAPDGTTIELFTDRGGTDNSLNITLDDEGGLAPIPEAGVDAANARIGGRYRTENSTLSELYQKSGIGQWLLTIVDDTPGNNLEPGNDDVLNNWALIMHCRGVEQVYLPVVFKDS